MMENSLSKKGNKFLKALSVSALIGLFSLGTSVYAESAESVELLLQGETNLGNLTKATVDIEKKNSEFLPDNNSKDSGSTLKAGFSGNGLVCGNDACMVSAEFSNLVNVQQGEIRGSIIRQVLQNNSTSTYPDVDRDMYNNTLISTYSDVNGGLIYNGIKGYNSTAKFLTINNRMYDNYVEASANVRGGLVYNGNVYQADTTSIASLSSDMTGNTVTAGGDVYGGLIYNFSAGANTVSSIGTDASNIFEGISTAVANEDPGEYIEPGEAYNWEIPVVKRTLNTEDNSDTSLKRTEENLDCTQQIQKRFVKETETNDESVEDIVPIYKPAVERENLYAETEMDKVGEETESAMKYNLERKKEEITPTSEISDEEEKIQNTGLSELTEKDKWPNEAGTNEGGSLTPGGNIIINENPAADPARETTFNGIQGTISGNTIVAGDTVYGGIILNSTDQMFAIYYPSPYEDVPVPINNGSAQISQIDAVITGNTIIGNEVYGGIIYNDSLIGKISGEITNNTINGATSVNGAILFNNGLMGLGDLLIANNTSTGGATILNDHNGIINIQGNTILTNNISNGTYNDILNFGEIVLKENSNLTVSGSIISNYDPEVFGHFAGEIFMESNSTLNAANEIKSQNVILESATLNLSSFNQSDGTTTYGTMDLSSLTVGQSGTINAINNHVYAHQLGEVYFKTGNLNYTADVDLANAKMDSLDAVSFYNPNDAKIQVNGLNLISDSKDTKTEVYFTTTLKDIVVNNVGEAGYGSDSKYQTTAYSPIFRYDVGYENRDDAGYFVFSRGSGSDAFNPAVLAAPVTAQAAAQTTMNLAFNYVFEHADGFMSLSNMERMAKINSNSYALSTDFNQNLGRIDVDHANKGVWVRPYTAFESMPLKHGPKVDITSYGTFVGFDSEIHRLKHGWANVGTAYIGYNGAQLRYNNVDSTMNGGMLGLTETFYKGNFFTALTATAGAGVMDTKTMYGSEDSAYIMGGIGSKTGYNFEFKGGKFIIQPIMFMSYSIVKGFDYTNAAGVRINSEPSHTVEINPSVRFIGNIEGWQPYASVGMVWDVLHESNTKANGIKLPEMYTKPYVQYGVGLQRCWDDKFSAFGQAMLRNGGRNGISLTFGFRWALGKGAEKVLESSPKVSLITGKAAPIQESQRKVIKQLSQTQKTQLQKTTRTSMNAIIE